MTFKLTTNVITGEQEWTIEDDSIYSELPDLLRTFYIDELNDKLISI